MEGLETQGRKMPSDIAPPTRVDTEPQQAATGPMSGSTVQHDHSTEAQGQGQHSEGVPTFKDQVLGYAKKTRGTLLGKPETKETGQRLIDGDVSARQILDKE